ncbi:MotA/TolQ/ExbB proton channel family protein [Candidatus Poribacteria bacterium]|nr:MotA/TolQ/ExbB proton channel family protein [Candidatus Poribacteria bacterium]
MQTGFPKCNPQIVVYVLLAIAVWFSILAVIPVSLSQSNPETTSGTGAFPKTPEKKSIFELCFTDTQKGLYTMPALFVIGVVLIFIVPERIAFFWILSRPKKGNAKVKEEGYYKKKWFCQHLDVETFSREINKKVGAGDLDGAIGMCEKENHPVASVFIAGIEASQKYSNNPGNIDNEKIKTEVEKEMEIEGENQMGRLEQRLWLVDVIATLAPMFGFLGTIAGLISAFMDWGVAADRGEQVGIGTMTGGMYQAMLTTAVGLLIGIPATFANILINDRIKGLSLKMSDYGNEMLKILVSSGVLDLKAKSSAELERARRILESSEPVSVKQAAVESLSASMLQFPPEYRESHLDLLLNKLKDDSQPAELREGIASVLILSYYQLTENEQNRCCKDFEAISNQPGMLTLKRFIEIDKKAEDVADFLKDWANPPTEKEED